MKKISAIAAIIAVPTFIASVYGMNFDNMPELHWRFGYPLAIGAMALCVLALVTSSGGSTGSNLSLCYLPTSAALSSSRSRSPGSPWWRPRIRCDC